MNDAAAMWGLAENRALPTEDRLRCALQALELIAGEGDPLLTATLVHGMWLDADAKITVRCNDHGFAIRDHAAIARTAVDDHIREEHHVSVMDPTERYTALLAAVARCQPHALPHHCPNDYCDRPFSDAEWRWCQGCEQMKETCWNDHCTTCGRST